MKGDAQPVVKFARIIVLEGKLKKEQLDEIKNYCVNPVDSQIAENEKPETLDMEMTVPEDVATIEGFTRLRAGAAGRAIAGKWDLP